MIEFDNTLYVHLYSMYNLKTNCTVSLIIILMIFLKENIDEYYWVRYCFNIKKKVSGKI